jgi:site-specific recombinase XerC
MWRSGFLNFNKERIMQINRRYHTDLEQKRLLSTVRSINTREAKRDAAWMNLLRLAGMRIGEFSRLTIAQARLALEEGWLFIPKEHRKGKRRDHSVLVTEPMRVELRRLIDLQREFGGTGADDGPLVLSGRGQRMSVRSYQARYAGWCRQAGVQGSPHWMRHTAAMNIMRRSGAQDPRGIVQAALGHTTIASSGIYTAPSKEDLAEALSRASRSGRTPRRDMRARFEGVLA